MNETAVQDKATAEIDGEVSSAMTEYLKTSGLPLRLIDVQFLQLEHIKILHDVRGTNVRSGCTFLNGGGTVVTTLNVR